MFDAAHHPHFQSPHAKELLRQLGETQQLDKILTTAISEVTERKTPVMRGLQRLSNLTETVIASLDAEADKVADSIVASQQRAQAAIGKFRDFAGHMQTTADEIERALGQITNSPPAPPAAAA